MLTHLKAFFVDQYHTGAVLPSSSVFARMMTREARLAEGPRRILEVGPGAGPMTEQICKVLHKGDVFDVVEINPEFAVKVERDYLSPTRKRVPGAKVEMHIGPIQSVELGGHYDFLVCSLPFNNFDPELVRTILARFRELLAPTGQWCFFEYAGMRKVARVFQPRTGKKRLDAIAEIFREIDHDPGLHKETCWFNFPPTTKRRVVLTENAGS